MSKTTKIVLAVVAVFLLMCCGGGAALVMGGVNNYKSLAGDIKKVGDEAAIVICKDWSVDELMKRAGPTLASTPKLESEGLMKIWKEEFGSFVSGSGSMSSYNTYSGTSGQKTHATYLNNATFTKGDASIMIIFERSGNSPWKIEQFTVSKR